MTAAEAAASDQKDNPKTGDSKNIYAIIFGLFVLSLTFAGVVIFNKKTAIIKI